MLSDACSDFLTAFQRAAESLAEDVHRYSAPEYSIRYGWEIDALRRACIDVRSEPFDPDAGARILSLTTAVMRFHDKPPGSEVLDGRRSEMNRLVRLLQAELDEADAASVPLTVADAVIETERTPEASRRMAAFLSKLSSGAYDAAVKIISDVGSATLRKMLGL